MNIGKTELEHQSDIVSGMANELAKRFFTYARLNEGEPVDSTLIDLSKSIGYLTLVNNSVHKSFKQEKRIKSLEEKMKVNLSVPIKGLEKEGQRMLEDSQLEKYR